MSININLIRESLSAIKPHASQVIQKFHEELFVRYPQGRTIFSGEKNPARERNVINFFDHIADYFDDKEHLPDYLRKMGGRYSAYGTNPEYFSWIEDALLSTLSYFFEDQWTVELKQSWTEAYAFVTHELQIGMEAKLDKITKLNAREANTPDLQQLARNFAEELFKKAIEDQIQSPKFQEAVRQSAQEIFKKAIELEAKQMIEGINDQQPIHKIHVA